MAVKASAEFVGS